MLRDITFNNPFQNDGVKRLLDASDVLDAVSSSFFITNNKLQIVYCNKAFLNGHKINDISEIEGLNPGDVLGCYHALHSKNGCGTTEKCPTCNFRQSVNKALLKKEIVQDEAILTTIDNKMLAVLITATPFKLENEYFVSISTLNITEQKRKKLMESLYFHDLINLAGSLTGYIEVIQNIPAEEITHHLPAIQQISNQILDEITAQREISKAEQNQLDVDVLPIEINEFLHELKDNLNYHPSLNNRNLYIDYPKESFTLYSDKRLIQRILINMLKNSAESVDEGETIHLSVRKESDRILFRVQNPGYIKPEIQKNIFQFAFSTKGKGRGFGTYGIRLLGETMLKGKTWFTTTQEKEGTSFYLQLPLKLELGEENE